MPTLTDRLYTVHARGKDLAAVLRWARMYPVEVIRIDHDTSYREPYTVTFYFNCEGSEPYTCVTHWGDWRVLFDWLLARRSWGSVHRITIGHDATANIVLAGSGDHRVALLRKKGISVIGRSEFAKTNYPNKD
jgi:hypothetical protein